MISTKENILITALHLFAKDGYEAVSVSQIAGSLNMTKGALYRHYKSKRDIFDHIVEAEEFDKSFSYKEKKKLPGQVVLAWKRKLPIALVRTDSCAESRKAMGRGVYPAFFLSWRRGE